MAGVIKSVPMDELRQMVTPAENLNFASFDPSSGGGKLAVQKVNGNDRVFFDLNGTQYPVKMDAYKNLADIAGVSVKEAEETPVDLFVPVVNYHLGAHRNLHRISYATDGDRVVRNFVKGDYTPISDLRILDMIQRVAGDELEAHHVDVGPGGSNYSIITMENHDVDIRPGQHVFLHGADQDIIRGGISVENLSVVKGSLQLSTYLHRLVCMNGAYSVENVLVQKRVVGDGFDEWLKTAVEHLVQAVPDEVQRLRVMKEHKLAQQDISKTVNSVLEEFNIPTKLQKEFQNKVMDKHPQTVYDIYNIITDLASNLPEVLENPAQSRKLMRTGGAMAVNHEFCDTCHRVYA